ncbi:MAG: aminomethyl-transferring glycine dehydrogenase [Ignavibacteriaceae bacterium]|nr:aminomethyl-transferring glycine dehydrogenase [Ignavibacteriaceae bacterium]
MQHPDKFVNRHIGPRKDEIEEMLKVIGVESIDELINQTIPQSIRSSKKMELSAPLSEYQFLDHLKTLARKNKVFKSYIGLGYHPTHTPAVIQRNVFENPGWYTQYTPYQAEIAQGRLEALMNFQTTIIDLTGLPIANASLLDEGTAAAEAMIMLYSTNKNKSANIFFVSQECFPQTIDVLRTRSKPLGIELLVGNHNEIILNDKIFGILVQYPACDGEIYDYRKLFQKADELGIKKVVAADLLSLTLLTPPGEFGADVAVGTTQRFGIPMGFGGPHAAYFSTKDEFKRNIPGRIIGASIDSHGNLAYRMALQTREQHIRREKATSNICTAQVLLAVMAGMYAVYHGPNGLRQIAERIHYFTQVLNQALIILGYKQVNENFFDTLKVTFSKSDKHYIEVIRNASEKKCINLRYISDNEITISLNEKTDIDDLIELINIFEVAAGKKIETDEFKKLLSPTEKNFPQNFIRSSEYLRHPVFNSYHSETEMMRYIKSLEAKDLSLVHSMISLGSCTMKLNSAAEMFGVSWPEFSNIHPFSPLEQAEGYLELFKELEKDLCEITGFSAISLQPNSGAQGEYAGLMVIRAFHESRGESQRNVILIPSSAHGTNPASAVMAGMKVVVVNSTAAGNVDVEDLKKKIELNKQNLAGLMITYPSTHGVFEEAITEICKLIHENGGLVYMDGANMNAQVGLTSPAIIGADVCHLNLHKTFSIPHGGGGPGVGPIAVTKELAPFLPGHSIVNLPHQNRLSAVSSAPWGSASVLIISYAYLKLMGADGLTKATEIAILNANYIKARLEKIFPVLYSGEKGRVAHELIFDTRVFKESANIEVEDIAKRLMDYGYHAPTVSFPVAGTLMVEPTESESKTELDNFCDTMLLIAEEIKEVESGIADPKDNVLKNSPHTIGCISSNEWIHSYSREKAAFPVKRLKSKKFWPSVGRVNNAYGDRNLVCSCNPISDYIESIEK